jgi:hypothetical protein
VYSFRVGKQEVLFQRFKQPRCVKNHSKKE